MIAGGSESNSQPRIPFSGCRTTSSNKPGRELSINSLHAASVDAEIPSRSFRSVEHSTKSLYLPVEGNAVKC